MKTLTVIRRGGLLVVSCLVMLITSGCWFSADQSEHGNQPEETAGKAAGIAPPASDFHREIIIPEKPHHQAEVSRPDSSEQQDLLTPPVADKRPQVAIIIDDMGYHRKIGDQLLAQNINLSFSFLPLAPFAEQQEEKAYQLGRDILVHLPMEASDSKWDPGPGALYLAASRSELATTLKKDLAAVPHAIGANNHMGSKFTENRQAMRVVLGELKAQGLFFIDSFTTAKSTGMTEAKKMGLKTGRRHIFLDNVQDPTKICSQLNKLAAVARKQKQAIGIGHPYQATLDAIRSCGEQLLETVQVVPVHELVE